MLKTDSFYENVLGIRSYQVQKYMLIIEKIENGKGTEEDIRSLGEEGLKVCLCEGKFELFKKLVGPISFKDSNGNKYYKYLLDAISLGLVEFIEQCPESLMSGWVKYNNVLKDNAKLNGEEFYPVPVEYAAKNSLMLYPSLKKELLDAIFKLDKEKIMSIRIKDVRARQISGMGHPVRNVRDVIYYAESPVVYPCIELFSKNVVTTANDTGGCYDDAPVDEKATYTTNIIIDYESLDQFNKIVADSLVESGFAKYQDKSFVGKGRGLILEVPCKRNDLVYTVNSKFIEMVSRFHKQDMIYGVMTVEDIYDKFVMYYHFLSDEEVQIVNGILEKGYTSDNILEALKYFPFISYYYDKEEDKFWIEKSYYDRHKMYLEEQPNFGGQGLK